MFAEALLPLLLAVATASATYPGETGTISVRSDLVDVEIGQDGSVHMLFSGLPHLLALYPGGGSLSLDLTEVALPGGFCMDGAWGWLVTDQLGGRAVRFGPDGEVLDSLGAPGRPGDICLSGLTPVYVDRASGRLRTAGAEREALARLSGDGMGQLTASGGTVVYSDGTESLLVEPLAGSAPLAPAGTWAIVPEGPLVLRGDTLLALSGPVSVLPDSLLSRDPHRLSSSPDGSVMAVWSPGEGEVLVLR